VCGIAGLLAPDRGPATGDLCYLARVMAERLHHRGPDAGGCWSDEAAGVALAARRLAILDVSPAGNQPMASSSGRHVLVLNGEIYNHVELRRELGAGGASFRGGSDTEVLVEAVDRWGLIPALERLNGMFAFAVWDRQRRRLSLARDRLGEKPLYHGWVGGAFAFGSELKALRAVPGADLSVDRDALALLLRFGYVPAPRSIHRGIAKLPPGTWIEVDPASRSLPDPQPYWSAREAARRGLAEPFEGSPEEAVDAVQDLLDDSVRLRLRSDVPLGAFLSGGIDSSLVVSSMTAAGGGPVRTYTIGSPDPAYDESAAARAVARHFGTEHTEVVIGPSEALALVPTLSQVYDEPFADPSQLPTMLVSQLARRDVVVALSGDGGDELFGGYTRYHAHHGVWARTRRLPRPVRRSLGAAVGAMPAAGWNAVGSGLGRAVPALRQSRLGEKIRKLGPTLAADSLEEAYVGLVSQWSDAGAVVLGADGPSSPLDDPLEWRGMGDPTDGAMYLDTVTYLPDDLLTKVDRASMAVSLEARVPLLDHRLVELAWRLPRSAKIRDGQGKWVLRQVLARRMPEALFDRPKMGFGVPMGQWLRGPLREWAEDLLAEGRLRDEGYFDPAPIRARWAEHLRGRRSWNLHLWNVLTFQAWLAAQGEGR
jgi:asparagine synthase (glutamine-hydrolysing)